MLSTNKISLKSHNFLIAPLYLSYNSFRRSIIRSSMSGLGVPVCNKKWIRVEKLIQMDASRLSRQCNQRLARLEKNNKNFKIIFNLNSKNFSIWIQPYDFSPLLNKASKIEKTYCESISPWQAIGLSKYFTVFSWTCLSSWPINLGANKVV